MCLVLAPASGAPFPAAESTQQLGQREASSKAPVPESLVCRGCLLLLSGEELVVGGLTYLRNLFFYFVTNLCFLSFDDDGSLTVIIK